ncbi:uncharacterized protein LOC108679680 [Hyalella azteca]|uniref:Uncharacterized protein LOC108679680 n=1 Tax=Hyalella azteca TaxID=294128 RepID=A0A8B7PCX9_HYAAZ|nr:uncharacterized protein LOC108679680 [Hyalella azteca]
MLSSRQVLLLILSFLLTASCLMLSSRQVLLLILSFLLTASCLMLSSRTGATPPYKSEQDGVVSNSGPAKMFAPILPIEEKEVIINIQPNDKNEVNSSVHAFPAPLKLDGGNKVVDYPDYEYRAEPEVGVFGSIAASLNLPQDSVLNKALNLVDNVKQFADDGTPIMESVFSFAKGLKSMSKKVSEINRKIDNKKLKLVQGFVDSKETKPDYEYDVKRPPIPDPPLGPEARKNTEFEKQMQHEDKKPSLLKSIAQNVGPAILAEYSRSVNDAQPDGGPSLIENIFINVGPKIIAETFGGGNDNGNDKSENGFNRALKFLAPFVRTVVENQEGDKDDVNTAVSSIMRVMGNLSPLFEGGGPSKRPLGDTLVILKPVLDILGPSIMDKILDSKKNEQLNARRHDAQYSELHEGRKHSNKTIVDKMLNGLDEKTVGQAMGRALTGILVKALPDTVKLPRPSEIRRPYDMAVNLLLGNPRNNSKEIWHWLRKLSGENEAPGGNSATSLMMEEVVHPKRALFKEDIRHFYGLLNYEEDSCRNRSRIGGVYDWKKDLILGSRVVCEDFDLWKAPLRDVVAFGRQQSWSFEEELAKRGNIRVHALDQRPRAKSYNHTQEILVYPGRLLQSQPSDSQSKTFAGWLTHWGLLRSPLHLVKLDLGGGEWQILQSLTKEETPALEDILQLSVTVRMEEAIKDPSLYSAYAETIETLASLGHQLFSVVPESTVPGFDDPLVAGHQVAFQYELGFVRI